MSTWTGRRSKSCFSEPEILCGKRMNFFFQRLKEKNCIILTDRWKIDGSDCINQNIDEERKSNLPSYYFYVNDEFMYLLHKA